MAEVRQYTPRSAPPPTEKPVIAPEPQRKSGGHIWWREMWVLLVFGAGAIFGAAGLLLAMDIALPLVQQANMHALAAWSAVSGK